MPSISGLPMPLWLPLHQWPFLASHNAKTQLISMTPSFLQNQYHLGVRRAWGPYKHELSLCTSGRSLSSLKISLPVIFFIAGELLVENLLSFLASSYIHLPSSPEASLASCAHIWRSPSWNSVENTVCARS